MMTGRKAQGCDCFYMRIFFNKCWVVINRIVMITDLFSGYMIAVLSYP
ncbi:hypothetical Protein YC6258_03096 [Gynuella sunshinyii YC6258]|uniref:Uncharacterized protein n=1 Tax=Gynuella sunshinyii YC6258 TaxID=1445510 RepID=A0A0C5VKB7_9GAMM|nr:hypothetical Protein YC6258_03096 [Gynuella sunshinyii YC6258]